MPIIPFLGDFVLNNEFLQIFLLSFSRQITIPFDGLVPLIVSPCIDCMIEFCLLTLLATCYHIIGVYCGISVLSGVFLHLWRIMSLAPLFCQFCETYPPSSPTLKCLKCNKDKQNMIFLY